MDLESRVSPPEEEGVVLPLLLQVDALKSQGIISFHCRCFLRARIFSFFLAFTAPSGQRWQKLHCAPSLQLSAFFK